MSEPIKAFPLQWPPGWRRTDAAQRTAATFGKQVASGESGKSKQPVSISLGTDRVLGELDKMGFNTSVVISSNLMLRSDGMPRGSQRAPDDPGVAVYWGRGIDARCIAVDRYDRVADNLAAIAATLYAMRAIERHGGAEILDRAFTGFVALPAPEQPFTVLGCGANASQEEIETAFRKAAMKAHPDKGGSDYEMARVNAAREAMLGRANT